MQHGEDLGILTRPFSVRCALRVSRRRSRARDRHDQVALREHERKLHPERNEQQNVRGELDAHMGQDCEDAGAARVFRG